MKKLLAILIFIVGGSFIASSQNYLTIGQVYNFNVGDEFETANYMMGYGPTYYQFCIVTKKWYSLSHDTLYYRDSVIDYNAAFLNIITAGYHISVDTSHITNLNGWAKQDTTPNDCSPTWDSVYYSTSQPYCGDTVWERGPYRSCWSLLFNPNVTQSWVVEGCGGPYWISSSPDINDNEQTYVYELIFYKKGNDSCGTRVPLISSVPGVATLQVEGRVFPNPSKGVFTFRIMKEYLRMYSIEVYDVMGEKIIQSSLPASSLGQMDGNMLIDLTSQPDGIYFYRVVAESGELIGSGKLIIQK